MPDRRVERNSCVSNSSLNPSGCNIEGQDKTGVQEHFARGLSKSRGFTTNIYNLSVSRLLCFICTIELVGCTFTGDPAKNTKQAEKNAAMSAWSSLKLCKSCHFIFMSGAVVIWFILLCSESRNIFPNLAS